MIKNTLQKASLAVFFLAILLSSCKSHFDLTKTNRKQYPISKEISADSVMIKSYLPFKEKMDSQMTAIIGKSDSLLYKGRGLESNLGNFFADACMNEARKLDPEIDFAMPSTTGGLRNSLPKGNISLSNVFELMPFENELLVLKLNGSDAQDLITFIAASGGQPVAGIRMKIKDKVASDILINGKPFDAKKTYSVLTSDYIAGGGDSAKGLANPIAKKTLGLKVRDALIQYIKAQTAEGKTITGNLDGRIISY